LQIKTPSIPLSKAGLKFPLFGKEGLGKISLTNV
jgi:hypothetical protein